MDNKHHVEFSTRDYEQAHGKQPRGRGSWAFCPMNLYRRGDYLTFTKWFSGTYAQAKKQAAAHFAAEGIDNVVVCS